MDSKSVRYLLLTGVLVLGIILSVIFIKDLNSDKNSSSIISLPSPALSGPIDTPTPSIQTALGSESPMINCNIDINCGGGTKYVSKEACLNSTCCLIIDKFVLYDDRNKCLYDQAVTSGSSSASFTPVNAAVYVSTYNAYIYCKPESIPQIKSMNKVVKEWIEKMKSCSSGTQYDYSNCLSKCSDINSWPSCSLDCKNKSNASSCDAFKETPINDLNALINNNCG